MKTKLCVACGALAVKWVGHNHIDNQDKEEIEAGWCINHNPSPIYLAEEPVQVIGLIEYVDVDEEGYIDTDCTPHECYGVYKYDIIEF